MVCGQDNFFFLLYMNLTLNVNVLPSSLFHSCVFGMMCRYLFFFYCTFLHLKQCGKFDLFMF